VNPTALLALIADLYTQIRQLQEENAELRKQTAAREE